MYIRTLEYLGSYYWNKIHKLANHQILIVWISISQLRRNHWSLNKHFWVLLVLACLSGWLCKKKTNCRDRIFSDGPWHRKDFIPAQQSFNSNFPSGPTKVFRWAWGRHEYTLVQQSPYILWALRPSLGNLLFSRHFMFRTCESCVLKRQQKLYRQITVTDLRTGRNLLSV